MEPEPEWVFDSNGYQLCADYLQIDGAHQRFPLDKVNKVTIRPYTSVREFLMGIVMMVMTLTFGLGLIIPPLLIVTLAISPLLLIGWGINKKVWEVVLEMDRSRFKDHREWPGPPNLGYFLGALIGFNRVDQRTKLKQPVSQDRLLDWYDQL